MRRLIIPLAVAGIFFRAAPAAAASFEGGLQLGVIDRRLGSAAFRTTMNAQLYADAILSPYVAVGAYWNGVPGGNVATPERLSYRDVSVTVLGVRAKVFMPLAGRIRPYATFGIGRATAEFPDARGTVCAPLCEERASAAATRRYAEVPLGLGVRVDLEGPFVFTAEGSYRVALGYAHEAYERTLQQTARTGGRAWTLHVALAVAF